MYVPCLITLHSQVLWLCLDFTVDYGYVLIVLLVMILSFRYYGYALILSVMILLVILLVLLIYFSVVIINNNITYTIVIGYIVCRIGVNGVMLINKYIAVIIEPCSCFTLCVLFIL